MEYSFEQLPQMVGQLAAKLEKIEQLLLKQSIPSKEQQDQILDVAKACRLLNLAKPTVYGLVSQGKLPYMKRGKKLYFNKLELLEWLQQGHKAVKDNTAETVDKTLLDARGKRR